MSLRLTAKRKAFSDRRAQRVAARGQEFECGIEAVLLCMKEQGIIADFLHHSKYSPEDLAGKDFTVWVKVGEEFIARSFGVTISRKSVNRAKLLHQEIPQFYWPIETKPETIHKRILELFPC